MVRDGALPVAALDPEAVGLKRMRFSLGALRAVRHSAASREPLTVQVAAERLGLKWEVASHLVRVGVIGGAPDGIPLSEVERFARDYVTGAQLARNLRTSPRGLAARLAASGVLPIVGPEIDGSRQNIFSRADVAGLPHRSA